MATKNVDSSLDSILVQLGDFGRYQAYVFGLVCFAVVLHSAVHIAYVFTAMDIDYRCKIPNCDSINSSDYNPKWLRNAVPFVNNQPKKCEKFLPRIINATTPDDYYCSPIDFNRDHSERCNAFTFRTEEISILQEYNLYCEENLWKLTMVGTVNSIGQFFGLFIAGMISDKYGRRMVLIWGMVLCGFFGILRSFAPTYTWFLVFEFLDAAFGSGSYICGFILGVELVGPKKRVLTGTIASSCYAIGEVFTASTAWLVKSWKPLIYILYSPTLLLLSYFWLVPESVRWHLSKGQIAAAKETLRKTARINGVTLSKMTLEKLDLINGSSETAPVLMSPNNNNNINAPNSAISTKYARMSEVFTTPLLLFRFINCCFCWVTCAFLFYGLTLNSVALAGNSYLDFILTSLVEIPAYFSCVYFVDTWGRKASLSCAFLLTGVCCFVFLFVPTELYYLSLIVYLMGKFAATAAFTVTYVITSELFPTPLRNTIMGACSTFGRIGSMISPQIPLLAQAWRPLPMVMFASMAATAGLLTLIFPETVNIKLPDTIEEAVSIGKKRTSSVNDKI